MNEEQEVEILEETPTTPTDDADTTAEKKFLTFKIYFGNQNYFTSHTSGALFYFKFFISLSNLLQHLQQHPL